MRLELQAEPGDVVPLAPRRRDRHATGSWRPPSARPPRCVIAVLGAQVVRQQDQLDDMESALEETTLEAAANRAFDDPDAVKVQLQSSDGDVPDARWCSPTAPAS